MSSATASAAAPLSASQLQLFNACAAMLNEAAPQHLEPLTQLHERLIHQTSAAASAADNVAVALALLPEMRVKLASGGVSASKLRIWLIDFLAATLQMDAKTFTPHVVSMLITMTADEKSEHSRSTPQHSRLQGEQLTRVCVLVVSVAVVKKLVSCGCSVYPLVYAWLLAFHSSWGAVHERLLSECVQLKSQLLAMWESPTETVKPLVIKFSEVVALTLTNDRPNAQRTQGQGQKDELRPFTLRDLPPHHRELDAAKLRAESRAAFSQLVMCLPSVATTFSALLKSLGSLSKLRSAHFGAEVADRLRELADIILMEEAQLQILPSEQQVKRVKADVKATIVDVLRALNPSVSSAEQQQSKLVEALDGLGAAAEARELTRQIEKRKAQHTRQIADAHTMELGANSNAGPAASTAAASVPAVEYDLVADADSHEMQILAFHLSQLPAHSITQLVMASLQHFVPPVSVLQQTHSRDLSSLFVQFVAACNQNPSAPASKARSSLDQRQTAEIMLAQAAMATSMTPAAAAGAGELSLVPMQRASSLPPVPTLTAVPPIPVPTISEKGYESLSRSAFARIASVRTQQSVSRSGESALRNVILAKLAATNLVHPLRYTHTVDPDLDPSDPSASQWSSSLVATENHQLLSTAITQDWSSYDNALNWLYSLLVVDPTDATIDTKIKRKTIAEMDGTDDTEDDDKTEGTDNTAAAAAAASPTPNQAPINDSGNNMADAAVSESSGSKRKRDDDDADEDEVEAADGDDVSSRVNKRSRSSASASAASVSAVASALSASLSPSCLPPFSVHGTVEYEETLARLLKSLESSPLFGTAAAASSSRQNLYSRFLLDIPLLTPAVFQSIDGCVYDPARSVIGLSTLRDLILYRPPVRAQSLDLLLSYTWKPDQAKLRNQSIRLVVNHLFTPNPHLRAPIIDHAHRLLDALALPQTLEDLPEIVVNVVVPPVPVYDKIVLPPLPKDKVAEAAAAAAAANTEPSVKSENGTSLPSSSPALVAQSSTESRRSLGDLRTRQEIASMIADADRRKREFDRLVFFRSLREKEKKLLEQQRDERVKRRTDRIARHLELFMALCTRQPSMLRRLLQVYRRCDEFVRKCIHDQIPPLITALMRLDQDMLVQMLEQETIGTKHEPAAAATAAVQPGAGDSSSLVLHALQLMTDRAPPSPSLVSSVQRMLSAHPDNPRYLIPILPGLPADAIRRHLPRLIQLPADALRVAFRKLLHSKPPAAIKPAELMVALHLMQPDSRKRSGAPLSEQQSAKERKEDEDALDKRVVSAKKLLFDDPVAYPPDVLGVVLTQLSDAPVLPRLLLHTVIMAMRLHPSLKSFIVSSLLMKLIHRKVYTQPLLWGGFMRTCNELRPQSIPVLVQLPDQAFEHMMHMPNTPTMQLDDLRKQIVTYVQSFPLQVRHSIRKIVQYMEQEKAMQLQMQMQQQQQLSQQAF